MTELEDMMSVDEVARKLRVKAHTVRVWMSQGKLLRTKVGRRTLVKHSELKRFVASFNPSTLSEDALSPAA